MKFDNIFELLRHIQSGCGLFKSNDRGFKWNERWKEIPVNEVCGISIKRLNDPAQYRAMLSHSRNPVPLPGFDETVLRFAKIIYDVSKNKTIQVNVEGKWIDENPENIPRFDLISLTGSNVRIKPDEIRSGRRADMNDLERLAAIDAVAIKYYQSGRKLRVQSRPVGGTEWNDVEFPGGFCPEGFDWRIAPEKTVVKIIIFMNHTGTLVPVLFGSKENDKCIASGFHAVDTFDREIVNVQT